MIKNEYKIFGLVGKKIEYSFSRSYFEKKFKDLNLPYLYKNFDLNSIEEFKKILNQNQISGLNVTIPYKQSIIKYLDKIDPIAQKIGAVNNVLPPRFSRLRKVTLHKLKYLSCSCGYSVRNKLPCRHILCLTGKCSIEMVAPRWLKMYQYSFERTNYEILTKLYRSIESDHYCRDIENKETIYVSQFAPTYVETCEDKFPKRLVETTISQMTDIIDLIKINQRNDIAIRGFPIKEQVKVNELPEKYSDTNMVVDFSQDTLEMLDNDIDFIKKHCRPNKCKMVFRVKYLVEQMK